MSHKIKVTCTEQLGDYGIRSGADRYLETEGYGFNDFEDAVRKCNGWITSEPGKRYLEFVIPGKGAFCADLTGIVHEPTDGLYSI